MSMDPQDWVRGQPDAYGAPSAPVQPAAPYAPAGTAPRPYGQASPPAGAAHPRDPYAYDASSAGSPPAPVTYPVHAPGYPQTVYPQTVYTPADHPQPDQRAHPTAGAVYAPAGVPSQSGLPPYPTGPYPQPYVEGAYGQRSAYGEYSPTSYGASGYQPMPFTVLPTLAGFGARVAASLIDGIVPLIGLTVGIVALVATSAPTVGAYGSTSNQPTSTGVLVFAVVYLAAAVFSLWNRTFRQGRTGQSIGKQAVHIRLLKEATMAPPGALLTFGRELAHQIDGAIYIGYLWPLWDDKKQTLADKICSTVVVIDG